jgi:sulfatase-like protein
MHWARVSFQQIERASEDLGAWTGAVVIFSAFVLGTHQFVRESLPNERLFVVPTEVMIELVFILRMLPAVLLVVVDRVIASRLSSKTLAMYRTFVISGSLILILRQLELYSPTDQVADEIHDLSPVLLTAVLLCLAAVLVWLAARFSSAVYKAFFYLAFPSLVLTTLLLLYHASPNADYGDYGTKAVEGTTNKGSPAVVIVFDMFAYEALLGLDRQIDEDRFPNFARLAQESLLLENATANFFATYYAVPSILDSILPLEQDYAIRIYEQTPWIESMYSAGCGTHYTCRGARYSTLSDKARVEKNIVLRVINQILPGPVEVHNSGEAGDMHDLSARLLEAMATDILAAPEEQRIYFLHSHLPHDPFVFDEDGDFHDEGTRRFDYESSIPPDGPTAEELWGHYLDQIEYTDLLLGELLDHLEGQGLFDTMTLIVTADHGLRSAYPYDAATIPVDSKLTRIPMFIHAPGIATARSEIDYQHVDFGPTLYDLLGYDEVVTLPPRTTVPLPSGSSIFADSRPPRSKEFFVTTQRRYWRWVLDSSARTWGLREIVEQQVAIDPDEIAVVTN